MTTGCRSTGYPAR